MSKPEKPKNLYPKKKLKYISRNKHRDSEIAELNGILPTVKNFDSKQIDIESQLRCPKNSFEKKTEMVSDLDNVNEDYRKFILADKVNIRDRTEFYFPGGYRGSGRGFGNLDDNMNLRYGKDTRQDKKNISDIETNRFQKLFRNYQNPDNLVLPFARGGIDTRNFDKYTREN